MAKFHQIWSHWRERGNKEINKLCVRGERETERKWVNVVSVTTLGDFWKFLVLAKEAQIIGNFLAYFEKPHTCTKTALATFWATFGKKLPLFIPKSGHAALPTLISKCCKEINLVQRRHLIWREKKWRNLSSEGFYSQTLAVGRDEGFFSLVGLLINSALSKNIFFDGWVFVVFPPNTTS